MQWEVFIIPLIAFAAWVLSTVFKGEDPPQRPPMRRLPPPREDARPRSAAPRPEAHRSRSTVDAELRTSTEATPPRQPQRPQPASEARPRRPAAPVTVAVPAEQPVALPLSETVAPPPLQILVQPARKVSPLLAQLAPLLKSPRSAGVAIVLREIFDPPLSQRRR